MRVLICGSREFPVCEEVLHEVVEKITSLPMFESFSQTTLISGAARGADRIPIEIAGRYRTFVLECYPANWKKYGKGAGFIRNKQMLEEGEPDYVISTPGGNGTAHMISLAEKAGVPVIKMFEGWEKQQ